MPRPLRIIALTAAAITTGIIATISVAWTCAIYCDSPDISTVRQGELVRGHRFHLDHPIVEPGKTTLIITASGFGNDHHYFGKLIWHTPRLFDPVLLDLTSSAGWPFRALHGSQEGGTFAGLPDWLPRERIRPLSPYITVWTGPQERQLPIRPIWTGFALNTVLFAAPVLALLLIPGPLRRARRRRRGQCERCSYDLRGTPALAPCPECAAKPRQ